MRIAMPFELPAITIKAFTDACRTYHGIWRVTKLRGDQLEEALYYALDYDEGLAGCLVWTPGSHNAKADIRIEHPECSLGLSVKSGSPGKGQHRETIQLSGHRLGRAYGDMHLITRLLRELISDVTICFVHNTQARLYECLYVDSSVFAYPKDGSGWAAVMGPKSGRVSAYTYTSSAGLYCSIHPGLSYQIWWRIPRALCRQGPIIRYDQQPQR